MKGMKSENLWGLKGCQCTIITGKISQCLSKQMHGNCYKNKQVGRAKMMQNYTFIVHFIRNTILIQGEVIRAWIAKDAGNIPLGFWSMLT